MNKIVTFGVYDLLHIGHVLLFKRAKELGDYLIVAVQDDEVIKEKIDSIADVTRLLKGGYKPLTRDEVAAILRESL